MNTTVSRVLTAFAVIGTALLSTAQASAQQTCLPHDDTVEHLAKQFDEAVVGRGLTIDGKAMFELFVSESGTWTVVVSRPNGQSCVIAGGKNWQQRPLLAGDPVSLSTH